MGFWVGCTRGFDPRPRVGATDVEGFQRGPGVVSIRAPGWGRRGVMGSFGQLDGVSIRAPGWGRHLVAFIVPRGIAVSIRAPGWGRQRRQALRPPSRLRFDPRPRVGATLAEPDILALGQFRSAPPGGGDATDTSAISALIEFRSAPPGGGDGLTEAGTLLSIAFRSAPPGGGDRILFQLAKPVGGVSIRAPGWGRRLLCADRGAVIVVSIRAPGWGRLPTSASLAPRRRFDPRPRVGATSPPSGSGPARSVSIRAPGWGRPQICGPASALLPFRSAPPGGGDDGRGVGTAPVGGFDPRPRVGATQECIRVHAVHDVSIRAPGWGRRDDADVAYRRVGVSIRASGWGRLMTRRSIPARMGFDPRPRVGATSRPAHGCGSRSRFDPRPRVGATISIVAAPDFHIVSIRAPGWGRQSRSASVSNSSRFRSAPPGGGDIDPGPQGHPPQGFDPRPRVGATRHASLSCTVTVVSIRAPGWGRRVVGASIAPRRIVSIRAPGWGRPAHPLPAGRPRRFRSAPPGGGDIRPEDPARICRVSIRAPGWGRQRPPGYTTLGRSFDPRPRVGATRTPRHAGLRACGSFDPRPRVGATTAKIAGRFSSAFRSAPPGGGDSAHRPGSTTADEFRSAPPGGGDSMQAAHRSSGDLFRSAPPGGGDAGPASSRTAAMGVSIRAPGWGRPLAGRHGGSP